MSINKFIIIAGVIFCSCSSKKTDTAAVESTTPTTTFEQGLKDYKKEIPATNRDSKNNEWRNNVYRNKYYNFRIEFPKGWEYDDGTTKTTLARSFKRDVGAVISVFVTHIGNSEKPSDPNNIVASVPKDSYLDNFNEVLSLQNSKAENIKLEIGALNNYPAYLTSFNTIETSGNKSYTFLSKQIHCYQNGLIYQIALNVAIDYYDSNLETLYERVIDSFRFENIY